MILPISPDAPLIVKAAAVTVLVLHIGTGYSSLASGAVAMLAPKGGRTHRIAGHVFFASMLIMTGIGAVVAWMLPQRIATVAGGLAFYLTLTGWIAGRRRPGQVGRFEIGAAISGLSVAALGAYLGALAYGRPGHELEGLPFQPAVIFGSVALLGGLCDLSVLRRGGTVGGARVARHAWRMSAALIVAGMATLGQPRAIPDAWEGSPLLFAPILITAAIMAGWLIRLRWPRLVKRLRLPALRIAPVRLPESGA